MVSFQSLLQAAPRGTIQARKLEGYYNGEVALDALGVSLPPATRVLEMTSPFPKLAVDVLAESLTPEGYIVSIDDDPDDKRAHMIQNLLRHWWQANDLDTNARLAITEALVQGASYWVVGPGDTKTPRVTAHSRLGVAIEYGHMGEVVEGLRMYRVGDNRFASHYLPGRTDFYAWNPSRATWELAESAQTRMTRPAIVPMINRHRLGDLGGRSELLDVLKMSDAASRSMTNLQVAQELLSMPLRYFFGKGARENIGPDRAQAIANYFGNLITGPEGIHAGQLAGADLTPIINSYKLYAQQISAITGIPPAMLGISTDNPSSAEAMRVAKERLIARAEVRQELFGDALEAVAILQLEQMGVPVDGLETLEMQWRDPAMTSASALTASMLQAQAQGIISAETAREYLRLTPEQRARERDRSRDLSAMTG